METFRAALKRHREARRWSQMLAAAECAMDHSLLSRLESGQRSPTHESIHKLSVGLELDPASTDRLYILAGFVPPAMETATMLELADIARLTDIPTLRAALALLTQAQRFAATPDADARAA